MQEDDVDNTIPILEERFHVSKTEVVTDEVRVTTSVDERAVLVDDVVERGELDVKRIPVDREVTEAPEPRRDGDTLIVSVVEERLVVEKRLFVIEELRITRFTTLERVTLPQTLRTMRANVERVPTSTKTGRDTDG